MAAESEKSKKKKYLLAEYDEKYYYVFLKAPPHADNPHEGVEIVTPETLFSM